MPSAPSISDDVTVDLLPSASLSPNIGTMTFFATKLRCASRNPPIIRNVEVDSFSVTAFCIRNDSAGSILRERERVAFMRVKIDLSLSRSSISDD